MKYYKFEKTLKEVTNRHLLKITCDWCGINITEPDIYTVREFELFYKTGTSYPEGGYTEGWEVEDLCDQCIIKLKNFLIENKVNIVKTETDW